jgi:eukaryotic-like serine/threonine-protein kinase
MEGANLHSSLIGATIGNYRVVSKLGEGGMGAVYLAEHPLIGKKVALKVLHEEYAANQDVVTRFFNEAKAVNDIGHPNIVDIIDYGVVQGAGPAFVYFIMEFLNGESLAGLLAREAPLPPERAAHIASQVADCLSASHAKGIIHRDLKPDNIYIMQRTRDKDFVKVLDFGIAKLTGGDSGAQRKTRTGMVMGTPAYMSPEQCEGRGNIDHRSDIYALGIVLYEMITGRVPFVGEGYGEVLVQQLTKAPARPSTVRGVVPPYVEAIIMRALEKRPGDRYENMEQFHAAIRDPQGFVEANGGIAGFYSQSQADGSPAAAQAMRPLSTPGSSGTPSQSGYGNNSTLIAGTGVPRPTSTLTEGAGQMTGGGKSKTPLIAAVAAAVLLIGGGVAFFAMNGKKTVAGGEVPIEDPTTAQANITPPEIPPVALVSSAPVSVPASAPVSAPASTPEVAVVKEVAITVTSNPTGAEVFYDGKVEGKTPVVLKLPKGEGEKELTLKLKDYKAKVKSVKLSRDAMIEVDLEKEPRRVTPPVVVQPRSTPASAPKSQPKSTPKTTPADDDDVLAPTF